MKNEHNVPLEHDGTCHGPGDAKISSCFLRESVDVEVRYMDPSSGGEYWHGDELE